MKNLLPLPGRKHAHQSMNSQEQRFLMVILQIGASQEIGADHLETVATGFVGTKHCASNGEQKPSDSINKSWVFNKIQAKPAGFTQCSYSPVDSSNSLPIVTIP